MSPKPVLVASASTYVKRIAFGMLTQEVRTFLPRAFTKDIAPTDENEVDLDLRPARLDHRHMGHDEHFLRRLDRVSDHHVELSLTLYRDEALLREVLSRAELPAGAERLAISLNDATEGPFVIVTRAGKFVTCLGEGMRVGNDLVVLTRPRLDAAIAKVERMRERVARVTELERSGSDGTARKLFTKVADEGLQFCREDAETLLQVWPLVGGHAATVFAESVGVLGTGIRPPPRCAWTGRAPRNAWPWKAS